MRVDELSAYLDASFEGDGALELRKVATLQDAGPDDLSFASRGKGLKNAAASEAGCLLVPLDFSNQQPRTIIRVADPRTSAARAILKIHPQPAPTPGLHPTAVVGERVKIGEGTSIGPGCVIADDVQIGDRCILHPRVTLYRDVTLGDDVILHSGCVLGADGFGFVMTNGAYEKFPQVGRVEIGNKVEIGANSCVDRAALGVTKIGDGTKIDNMVHIGHNCQLGRHVVIAAQTGLSGGVIVGDYAVIGGQVGIGDKARIESKAILGSGSGVLTSKIVHAGQVMWGTPARPLRECLEQMAVLSNLAKKRKTQ